MNYRKQMTIMISRVVLPISMLLLVVGCSKSETSEMESYATPQFVSEITRVTGTSWEDDDQVGVMMTMNNSLYTKDNTPYNARYNVDKSDGSLSADTSADILYYSVDANDYVDFYAYFPFREGLSSIDQNISLSVANQSDAEAIDFLEASTRATSNGGYNKYDSEVAFTFYHRLAKLTLNLSAGQGMSLDYITSVEIDGLYTSTIYDFTTCRFGSMSDIATITVNKESSTLYTAILRPNIDSDKAPIYTPAAPLLTVHTSLGDFDWDFTDSLGEQFELIAGGDNIFNVSVARTGVTVTSSTIHDWDGGNGGNVTAD